MNEHEKNELILKQRQEIERLTMENAKLRDMVPSRAKKKIQAKAEQPSSDGLNA